MSENKTQVYTKDSAKHVPNRLVIIHNEYGPSLAIFFNRKQLTKKFKSVFDGLVEENGCDLTAMSTDTDYARDELLNTLESQSSVKNGVPLNAKYVHVLNMVR